MIRFSKTSKAPYGALLDVSASEIVVQLYILADSDDAVFLTGSGKIVGERVDGAVLDASLKGVGVFVGQKKLISLEALQASGQWKDFGRWIFPVDGVEIGEGLNLFVDTFVGKENFTQYAERNKQSFAVSIDVPFRGASFDDCLVTVHVHPDYSLLTSNVCKKAAPGDLIFPRLRLDLPTSIGPNELIEFRVWAVDPAGKLWSKSELEVHLETTAGYLPLSRITLVKGEAIARLRAVDLKVGDIFKVKAGYHFFSGAIETSLEVQ